MKRVSGFFVRVVAALVLVAALAVLPARAADKVYLKDGKVLEGTITREEQGFVWLKIKSGTLEREQFLRPDEIDRIERDAAPAPDVKATPTPKVRESAPKARGAGVPRVALLTLGEKPEKEMVGMYITAKSLKEAVPLLEEEGVTDVVFVINSGGGLGLEVERLSDVIQMEYKPRFRTVAWIEWAISAAAMTAHCLEEIYFTPQGSYGACTGWYGALQAVKDRPLEEMLFEMEKISARGGHDPNIMRSMQIMDPLSYTIDSNGDVRWYPDLSGDHIANPQGRILTFTAASAAASKFSKGTAATKEELAKLMGYQEVDWVGEQGRDDRWPICRAERHLRNFRERTFTDSNSLQKYFVSYQTAVQRAQGAADRKERAKFVGVAGSWLDKIERMVENNENMAIMIGLLPTQFREWMEEQRKLLRDLMR